MEVAIDLYPLMQKLTSEEVPPIGLLLLLSLIKSHPGKSQAQLLTAGNLQYTRQALNNYLKTLRSAELIQLTPDDPGAKNKVVSLSTKGAELLGSLEEVVVKTMRMS